jgi:hypothetical protein
LCYITRVLCSQAREKGLASDQLPTVSGRYTAGWPGRFGTLGHAHTIGSFLTPPLVRTMILNSFVRACSHFLSARCLGRRHARLCARAASTTGRKVDRQGIGQFVDGMRRSLYVTISAQFSMKLSPRFKGDSTRCCGCSECAGYQGFNHYVSTPAVCSCNYRQAILSH